MHSAVEFTVSNSATAPSNGALFVLVLRPRAECYGSTRVVNTEQVFVLLLNRAEMQ